VTAPNLESTIGPGVFIRGSVMDISSGTKQNEQTSRFPNVVPCSADSSTKDWMEYVYQQKPIPNDFTGVPVTLYDLDSNSNYRKI
jgi:hypothetical protein